MNILDVYQPGQLLRKCAQESPALTPFLAGKPCDLAVPETEWDACSECSTADTMISAVESVSTTAEDDEKDVELPSIGSLGHSQGTCKPCAYFHKGGCGNGTDCPFCHLCAAGTIEQRRRTKKSAVRKARR